MTLQTKTLGSQRTMESCFRLFSGASFERPGPSDTSLLTRAMKSCALEEEEQAAASSQQEASQQGMSLTQPDFGHISQSSQEIPIPPRRLLLRPPALELSQQPSQELMR